MRYVDGFAINDDGRIVFEDALPKYYWAGMPFTSNEVDAGEQGGKVASVTVKSAFDANGEAIYIDLATTPYSGRIIYSGGIPQTPDGILVCDSVAGVWSKTQLGLPLTKNGYLAIAATAKPTPPGQPTVFEAKATGLEVDYKFSLPKSTPAVTKWEARYKNAGASIDQTVDITKSVYDTSGGYGVTTDLSPAGDWTIEVRATNSLGAGAWSAPKAVKTEVDPTVPVQLSVTPKIGYCQVELTPATTSSGSVDYYVVDIVDKTYSWKLADRKVAPQNVTADKLTLYIPSKVGGEEQWFTTSTGWDMDYTAVSDTGAMSDQSAVYTNPAVELAPTSAAPGKPTITSATGDANTFTVNFEPASGETVNGWFVGTGPDETSDVDYVWIFIANGTTKTYTGKAHNSDESYGVAVRAYSATGGMSDEAAIEVVTP